MLRIRSFSDASADSKRFTQTLPLSIDWKTWPLSLTAQPFPEGFMYRFTIRDLDGILVSRQLFPPFMVLIMVAFTSLPTVSSVKSPP